MSITKIALVGALLCVTVAAWGMAAEEVTAGSVSAARVGEEAAPATAPIDSGEGVAITVYNDGNAIVREVRSTSLSSGTGEVRYEDVAATIDPTTVKFRSITDPDNTTVLEQNYEYDLVSADKLLEKYINKEITVITKDGTGYTGRLMSFDGGQIVLAEDTNGPLTMIARGDNVRDIQFGQLPEGLITKPSLLWLIQSAAGGRQMIEVSYSAGGTGWRSDYTLVLNPDDTAMDFSGWVTLTNNSGKTYTDAKLKLIAGEVHRIQDEARMMMARKGEAMAQAAAPQFEEKAFAEYHLYTLPRATTIKDRQIKQIELLSAATVPVEKKYLFDVMRNFQPYWGTPMMDENYSVGDKGKVQVFINFKNDKASNMGMPLPAGRVRMFKRDNKDLEFVGEDSIEHTPKDEKVELAMGNAFDITGERKRANFTAGRGERWMEETFEITLRNHKTTPVTVDVREHLFRWTNWKIKASSMEPKKLDAQTIEFPVQLAPDEEKKVTYTVRYEW